MSKELPFEHLVDTIKGYRIKLEHIIREEYTSIDKKFPNENNLDIKSSKSTQQKIYNSFIKNISLEEFKSFRDNFDSIIINRDKSLERYVSKSIEHIKSWNTNQDLRKAHFIQTNARDKKTGTVDSIITQVPDYYDEKTIHLMIKNRTEEFVPSFTYNNISDNLDKVELLSVSNITGLYDSKDLVVKNIKLFDILRYKIYSRIKTSDRERDKFVDWALGLRDFDDYPYDSTGMIVVVPNATSLETSSEIYQFRDYVLDLAKKHKNEVPIQKNVKSWEQNANSNIKKLLDREYNKENYFLVMRQLRTTIKDLDEKFRNKTPILTPEENSKLLQGIQLKHYYENDRSETWIMNHDMYNSYSGKYIGHSASYIKDREEFRKAYLKNPALAYSKSKNPKEIEPSLYDLSNYLEMTFRNVFRFTNANS